MYVLTLKARPQLKTRRDWRKLPRERLVVPESPWRVSSNGRPTPENLKRFVMEWERRVTRREGYPVTVLHALVRRVKGGVVATYSPSPA